MKKIFTPLFCITLFIALCTVNLQAQNFVSDNSAKQKEDVTKSNRDDCEDPIGACDPPTNLTVAYDSNCNALLTWNAPEDNSAATYNLYRDNNLIESDITTTSYTDEEFDVFLGHIWGVKAVCDGGGESIPAEQSLDGCGGACNPPINLTANYNNNCDVELVWNVPEGTGEMRSLSTQPLTTPAGSGGIAFDVIAGAQDLTITALEIPFARLGETTIHIYYRIGTSCGFVNSSLGWILVGEQEITVPQFGMQGYDTYVPMPDELIIPAGETYGLYIATFGSDTDPGAVIAASGNGCENYATLVSNSDLTVKEGTQISLPDAPFTGTIDDGNFSGTIHYTIGGTVSTYNIYRDNIQIASNHTTTSYTDTDNNPFIGYTWSVKAVCESDEESMPVEKSLDLCEGGCTDYTFGTGITGHYALPLDYSPYSYSQQIYLASEISFPENGILQSVSFQFYSNTIMNKATNQTIYLANTNKNSFIGGTDWITTELVPVYQGALYFANPGEPYWVTIEFDTPFEYTGGNIVIAVLNNYGTTAGSSQVSFYGHTQNDNRVIFTYNSTTAYNPQSPPVGTLANFRNNIRFKACVSEIPTPCNPPTNLTAVYNSDCNVELAWNAPEGNDSFTYNIHRDNSVIASNITTTTYTDTDATTGHLYGVTAVCANDEESMAAEVSVGACNGTFVITATAGDNGTITPSGNVTVNYGANQTFTFTPDNDCYEIDEVIIDGSPISDYPNNSYTFENVTENHTIEVTFKIITYIITASAGDNGTILPSGEVTINCGENQTFTFTPDNDCYEIDEVIIDGSPISDYPTNSYTFENVTENHTIEVSFKIITYSITASAGDNGTISPNGKITVNCGEDQTFTFTPDLNYKISKVYVDDQEETNGVTNGEYTFINVTDNHSILVEFEEEVSIRNFTPNTISIYPNPTTGELRVTSYELQITSIEIFDVYGRNFTPHTSHLIPHTSYLTPVTTLDISHLAAGVYFVKIYTEEGIVTKKILKE